MANQIAMPCGTCDTVSDLEPVLWITEKFLSESDLNKEILFLQRDVDFISTHSDKQM